MPFNGHHMHPHSNGLGVDLNNNMHLYNQPSLLLATPLNPGQHPVQHSSASSESAGPADSSDSPTDSGAESTLSSDHSGSNPNLATAQPESPVIFNSSQQGGYHMHGGSQYQQQHQQPPHLQSQFYHQNGMIAQAMSDECQKMGSQLGTNNQYVSLYIV